MVEAAVTGWGLSAVFGFAGLAVGAVLGANGALFVDKTWYAEIQTTGIKECTLKLQPKEGGDELMAFLDSYMLP